MSERPRPGDVTGGIWRGRITRGPDGAIVGELTDPWGSFRLTITGIRDKLGGGYVLTATGAGLGAYRIAAIDGDGEPSPSNAKNQSV